MPALSQTILPHLMPLSICPKAVVWYQTLKMAFEALRAYMSSFLFVFFFVGKENPQFCIHDHLDVRRYNKHFVGWYSLGWNFRLGELNTTLALDSKWSYKCLAWTIWFHTLRCRAVNHGSNGDSYQRLRDNQSDSSLLIQVLSTVAGTHWSMLCNLTQNMQRHEKLIALRTQHC